MPGICYMIITIVKILIYALQFAMLLRAVMSWIPDIQDNKFSDFLYTVTEPVVLPVRMLFEKLRWFQNFPLDVSFIVAYLLLAILSAILEHLHSLPHSYLNRSYNTVMSKDYTSTLNLPKTDFPMRATSPKESRKC